MSWTRAGYVSGALLAVSCGPHRTEHVRGDTGPSLTAATYNLGLLDSVGFVEQRAPLVLGATAALDVDLLCVQEVWQQPHWDQLSAANMTRRPHQLRLPAEPGAHGRCSLELYSPLSNCAESVCAASDNLVACVTTKCASEVSKLDSGCTQCLLENAAGGDLVALRSACVGTPASDAPAPESRSYISGGSYGTGLLSTRPFAAADAKRLDASTVRRAILYGRLDGTALGTVHVFCTHLSALLTGLKYEGSYGSWDRENAAQVRVLLDWVHEKAGSEDAVLVLGDLNTGPAGAGITASVPESFALLSQAGFVDPFLRGPHAACTFCGDNPLVSATDTGTGAAIDHVLTRAIRSAVVRRVFDEQVEVRGADSVSGDAGGAPSTRRIGLSDHYGLRALLRGGASTSSSR